MIRTNGLARAALRFRPAAFAGTFLALLTAVAIVSACGILLETGLRAGVPPTRYAGAPVLVAADQQLHQRFGRGEGAYDAAVRVPDRARVPAALLPRLTATGARAVPDTVFPVRTVAAGPAGAPAPGAALTASGWGSTAFTGERLTAGTAPGEGQVVLAAGTAAVGDRVTLDTPAGVRPFRVSGLAATPGAGPVPAGGAVWFGDAQARVLSGHPDRLDAIALLPAPGTTTGELADRAGRALGGAALVHTGDDRATDPALTGARELLTGLGGSFGGVAAMVAVFTAAGTVALSVGQRAREYALLRAIGTTPRQIRRTIATEALLVAPVAGALGCVPGTALATWWFGQLKDKGAIPGAMELTVSWLPLAVAVGTGLLTALAAGYFAARRPSRTKPGQALTEAAVERLRPGKVRTPLGLVALAGGIVCAGLAAAGSGEDAANAALGVVMLFMLAVALLGPLIARAAAGLFGLPLRAAGPAASLAAANSRTHARRLASAITPIVLAMAFSSVLVFLHTSEDRATREQQSAGMLADRVVTGGLPTDAAARAAALPGVTAAVPVTRTSLVIPVDGVEGYLRTASAQAVSGDLGAVLDLGFRTGSPAALRPGTVALHDSLADTAGVRVGDRLDLRLPDGTPARPTVVATYTRGLGFGEVTLPAADLRGHLTDPAPHELLTRGSAPGLAALGGTVTDRDGWTTAQNLDRRLNAWANTTMAAVLGGFAAIAAANTLVMTVLDRRRELRTLRLVGSTRRQVLRMIRWEALLVGAVGLTLGTAIALATLVPLVGGVTGGSPYIPVPVYASFAGGILALSLTATALPARRALRPGTATTA
ncbi:ABC transporter permease [Streptomyces sp. NPDC101132]|uniref:ABC transporter permease n=1 Tax=Streptomyces sp. NPDC101132 TaxID=3366110 RepID=UPI003807EF01